MKNNCLICKRINWIKNDKNPYFVMELKTGYVVIGDYQFYKGYTLFLCKKHVKELHDLEPNFRKQFLYEMSLVAQAVDKSFKPRKINYELLGNTDSHLHWHIFPRRKNDPDPLMPIWTIKKSVRENDKTRPNQKILDKLKQQLKKELTKIASTQK